MKKITPKTRISYNQSVFRFCLSFALLGYQVGCSKGLAQFKFKNEPPSQDDESGTVQGPSSFFNEATQNPIVEPPKPEEVALPEISVPGENGEILIVNGIGESKESYEQAQNLSTDGDAEAKGTVSVIRETKPVENSKSRNALSKLVDGMIDRAKAFEIFGAEFQKIIKAKSDNVSQGITQVDEIKDLAQIIAELHNAENSPQAHMRIVDELIAVLGTDIFKTNEGSAAMEDIESLFEALSPIAKDGLVSPRHDTFLIYYLYFQQHSKNNSPDSSAEIVIGEKALTYFTERLLSAQAAAKNSKDVNLSTDLFSSYSLVENLFEDSDWIVKNLGPLAMRADLRKLGRSSQETFAAVIEAQLKLNASHLLSKQFLENALTQAEFAVKLLSPNKQRALVSSRYFNFSVASIDRLNRILDRHPSEFKDFEFHAWMDISDRRIKNVLRPMEKALRENDLLANRLRTVFTAPSHPYTQIYWGRAFMTEKTRDLVAKVAFEITTADESITIVKNRINLLGGGVNVFGVASAAGSLRSSSEADLAAHYLGSLMGVEAIRYGLLSKAFSNKSALLIQSGGIDLDSYSRLRNLTEQALGIRYAKRLQTGGRVRTGCEGVFTEQLSEDSFYLCNLIRSSPALEKEIQMSAGTKLITKKYLYLGPGVYSEIESLALTIETLDFHPLALIRLKPDQLRSPVANLNLKVKTLIEPWFESYGNGFDPNAADRPSGLSGRPATVAYRPEGGEYFHVYTSGEWPPPAQSSSDSSYESGALDSRGDKFGGSKDSSGGESSGESGGGGGGGDIGSRGGKGGPRLDFDPFDSIYIEPSFAQSVTATEMFAGKNVAFTDFDRIFAGVTYSSYLEGKGGPEATGYRRDLLRYYQLPIQKEAGAAVPPPPQANAGQAGGSFNVEFDAAGTVTGFPLFASFGGNGEVGFRGGDSPYWNGSTYVPPPRAIHFQQSGMTYDGTFHIEVQDPANARFQIFSPHLSAGSGGVGGAGGDAGGLRILNYGKSIPNFQFLVISVAGKAGRSGEPGFPSNLLQVTGREHYNFDIVTTEDQVGPHFWTEFGNPKNNTKLEWPNPYRFNGSHWSPGISPLNTQPHWIQRIVNNLYHFHAGWLKGSDRHDDDVQEVWRKNYNEYEVFRDHAANAANNLNLTHHGDFHGIDIVNNYPDWAWTFAVNQRNAEGLRPGMDALRTKLSSFINDQIQPLTFPPAAPQAASGRAGRFVFETK